VCGVGSPPPDRPQAGLPGTLNDHAASHPAKREPSRRLPSGLVSTLRREGNDVGHPPKVAPASVLERIFAILRAANTEEPELTLAELTSHRDSEAFSIAGSRKNSRNIPLRPHDILETPCIF
jgi:hypothetical protein